jgi:hypothetical protein
LWGSKTEKKRKTSQEFGTVGAAKIGKISQQLGIVGQQNCKQTQNLAVIRCCGGIKIERDVKSRSNSVLWGIKIEKRRKIS